jgi:hypothetical protein
VVVLMMSSQRHKRDRSRCGESTEGWAWSDALNRKAPPRRLVPRKSAHRVDKSKGSSHADAERRLGAVLTKSPLVERAAG